MSPRLSFVFCAALCLTSSQATAQEFTRPEPAQQRLYEEGAEAFRNGDYDKAVELFQASLHLGKLNITYLNLGRALFKTGRCTEALQAYKDAMTAPMVEAPSPQQVKAKMQEYRADLSVSCPGYLILECREEDVSKMEVQIDQEKIVRCTTDPVPLMPGTHFVIGTIDGMDPVKAEVNIKPMEERRVRLVAVAPTAKKKGDPMKVQDLRAPRKPGQEAPPATVVMGLKVGTTLGGAGSLVVDGSLTLGGESEDLGRNVTDFSHTTGYAFHGFGELYVLGDLGVGGSLGFLPGIIFDSDNGVDLGSPTFNQFDLNAYLVYRVPVQTLHWFTFLGGGYTMLRPDNPTQGTEDPFTGYNLQAGLGGSSKFSQWALNYDFVFQRYDASRATETEEFMLQEQVTGNRFMLNFGLGLSL